MRLKPASETFRKVWVIVKSWWIIAGAFLLAMSWWKWGLLLLFYGLSVAAAFEYIRVSRVPYKLYLQVSLILLASVQYLALAYESRYLFQILIPVMCLWLVPALIIFRATIQDLPLVFSAAFGFSFIIYYLSHIPALTVMSNDLGLSGDQAMMATLVLVFLTWGNDVFQFIAGKSFGRTKIVPKVSPNKTLGGFIGGIVLTTGAAVLLVPLLLEMSWKSALLIGPLLAVTGMFGDLFMSAVKRNIGTKDFSDLLPGHGGLLDRLDSLIFTAPVFFHILIVLNNGVA
jgi:phosphatidate cytidylyltransferase